MVDQLVKKITEDSSGWLDSSQIKQIEVDGCYEREKNDYVLLKLERTMEIMRKSGEKFLFVLDNIDQLCN